ncbi:MAG: galactose mutarotase [Saprospiraceae bacterium]|uniref:Aldose 1-epimerase n=1 Tax=Candidatus Opimibacter skivensis TaxID=2982028 RepID=A0A9D7STP7_9BACT|nr:galactose mutarotase [Candidatus Opimibacter skivensis]
MMSERPYGETPEGIPVTEYTLTNIQGIEMKVINYGCTITSLIVPDRDGRPDDIVLGFDSLEGYIASIHYYGAIIGRFANRIADGRFVHDGHEYTLAKNLNHHHLHGGIKGFDKVVWQSRGFENDGGMGVEFQYLSHDGEEGYPGNVLITVNYILNHNDEIILDYKATTDKKTIINLTQHSYFNLNGGKDNILQHELLINSDHFLMIDKSMIPTSELKDVAGTPFNFEYPKMIGRDIGGHDVQLKYAHGYDHSWLLDKNADELALAATLYDPSTGRVLDVFTTEPGLQLYTGNFLDDEVKGKNGRVYGPYAGLCLETQHFPDSPHRPEFPSVELSPGEEYRSKTIWKFSVRE